jgi:hypothetical protein
MEARTNWNDDRLDHLSGQVDSLRDKVDALRDHMDERFIHLEDRFDSLKNMMIIMLASILTTFGGTLIAHQL